MAEHEAAGLDDSEARRRLEAFGPNELSRAATRSFWKILAGAAREPMFLLLFGAASLYLVLGDLQEGLFLTVGAFLTVGLVVMQEARAERALAALRRMAQPYARVVRAGVERSIPARELVPGDLVLVGEGERLPADAVLVRGDMLGVDESMLTGESVTVTKQPDPRATLQTGHIPGGDGGAALFAGSLVVRGHGAAEVALTGASTALGRIGLSLSAILEEPTPLQRTARRLVGLLGALAVAFCAVVTLAYGLVSHDWLAATLQGVTVAIALIPEEFPMVLAVFLALGSWRLARHQVLARRPAVIEALGGATVLCVDKTGTLTENQMAVTRLWADGVAFDPEDPRAAAGPGARLVRTAALASPARSVDPMDRAVLDLRRGLETHESSDGEPIRTWPFRPDRLAVIQLWGDKTACFAAAKGAPEAIFRLCRLSEAQVAALHRDVEQMAAAGLRVLAVASCTAADSFPEEPEMATFAFEGLLGFLDPIRPDVPAAIREARDAGISVAMITGDYPATALAIARKAGLDTEAGVLTGAEIAAMDAASLQQRLLKTRIFARVLPEQKLALVEAFKAAGEVVAMTGDGVNDAPALEAAHIGISMGRRGTDVAREASDLVLLDDSFASIVGAIRLGRRIFANLRRALTFITAVHVPIAGLALLPVLFGLPPLLLPMHVVLVELVIDPTCALVFEAEPSEKQAMRRPPRRRDEPLFGPADVLTAVAQGAGVLIAVFGLYAWASGRVSEAEARGAGFAALIAGNLTLALVDSIASRRIFAPQRAAYWIIVSIVSGAMGLIFSVPFICELFRISPLGPEMMAGVGLAVIASALWAALLRGLATRAPHWSFRRKADRPGAEGR